MPDFDVEAFVARLDRMGQKLTSIPLADGKMRINRWRMLNAGDHTQQIKDLWATQIGDNQERIDVLAAHLAKAAPQVTVSRFGSGTAPVPSAAPLPSAASVASIARAAPVSAGPQIAPAQSMPPGFRITVGAPRPGSAQAAAVRPSPAGPQIATTRPGASGVPKVAGPPSSDGLQKAN